MGALETVAGMLSCGIASAPALAVLRRHGVRAVTVAEPELSEAARLLRELGGPATTPSGAAGLAGLMSLGLDPASRALILVTEADFAAAGA